MSEVEDSLRAGSLSVLVRPSILARRILLAREQSLSARKSPLRRQDTRANNTPREPARRLG